MVCWFPTLTPMARTANCHFEDTCRYNYSAGAAISLHFSDLVSDKRNERTCLGLLMKKMVKQFAGDPFVDLHYVKNAKRKPI